MITLDVIGVLYTPGEFDEEGNVLAAPTPLPGYHVNVDRVTPEIESFVVTPETPSRVFAGGPTFHLRFADEAEYLAAFYDETPITDQQDNPTGEVAQTPKAFVTRKPAKARAVGWDSVVDGVPQRVGRSQAKAVLTLMGLWDSAVASVEAIADPTERALARIALHDTGEWNRKSPILNSLAVTAFGMTPEQIDQLFIQANAIDF